MDSGVGGSPDLQVVQELARRFAAGELEAAFALYHPKLRIEQPTSLPHGGVHIGREGLQAMAATFGALWQRTISTPRATAMAGGGVLQLTTQTWTARSTGRSATVDVVELFALTDGLISELRVFQQDTHRLLATLQEVDPAHPARGQQRIEMGAATDRTLLTSGRILRCSGEPTERPADGDLLIEGDRIVQVSEGRLDIDRAATRVVDLKGATVLPGLADAHVHISWPLDFVFDHAAVAAAPPATHALDVAAVARTFVQSGYTLVIGAGVLQSGDELQMRDAIERGHLSGPRIVPSDLMITERGRLGDDSGLMEVVSDAAQLREVVARQCDAGVRALKLFISGDSAVPAHPSQDIYMNDAMLEAAVAEADRHGAFITVHARSAGSVAMAARTGVRLIHHACFLDDDALRALQGRGDDVWVCPGLHYLYAMVEGHAAPWGMTAQDVARFGYADELSAQVAGLRRLRSAGVRIVAGGDFGHQWTRHGTYAAELQRYVELVGMTPAEAICTATSEVGPLVGLPLGRIAEGCLADLLIVEEDPTADIAVLQRASQRRAVMKAGAFVYLNPDLVL